MTEMRRVPVDPKWRAPGDTPPTDYAPPVDDEPEHACGCPRLDPEDWHEVESDWGDATFVRTNVAAVLGVPLRFNQVRDKAMQTALQAGATVLEDAMLLIGPGRVRRPVLLEVEAADDNTSRDIVRPGGVAFSRLLPAPWGEMKRLARETEEMARARYGRDPDMLWVWYLTCSSCSSARDYETLFVAQYRDRSPA